ncbi:RNA-directed DNA polymerase, eukaryota [Artemisia annua]|uniref:RNA-directed DNA polymerase, eukaryota n=1 Tax=Artemisia annua TaxID=35608 RepID=A0A2U1LTB7_ARTAN|nr:RNA-directed DNA polymerase, eukaryota [Artemisia annua]
MVNQLGFGKIHGSTALRRSPRGGVELNQFEAIKAAIGNVFLTDQSDSWQWTLDVAPGYSVASARILVDDRTLEAGLVASKWNRHIPINVNVFLWRLNLNKLPSREHGMVSVSCDYGIDSIFGGVIH